MFASDNFRIISLETWWILVTLIDIIKFLLVLVEDVRFSDGLLPFQCLLLFGSLLLLGGACGCLSPLKGTLSSFFSLVRTVQTISSISVQLPVLRHLSINEERINLVKLLALNSICTRELLLLRLLDDHLAHHLFTWQHHCRALLVLLAFALIGRLSNLLVLLLLL